MSNSRKSWQLLLGIASIGLFACSNQINSSSLPPMDGSNQSQIEDQSLPPMDGSNQSQIETSSSSLANGTTSQSGEISLPSQPLDKAEVLNPNTFPIDWGNTFKYFRVQGARFERDPQGVVYLRFVAEAKRDWSFLNDFQTNAWFYDADEFAFDSTLPRYGTNEASKIFWQEGEKDLVTIRIPNNTSKIGLWTNSDYFRSDKKFTPGLNSPPFRAN